MFSFWTSSDLPTKHLKICSASIATQEANETVTIILISLSNLVWRKRSSFHLVFWWWILLRLMRDWWRPGRWGLDQPWPNRSRTSRYSSLSSLYGSFRYIIQVLPGSLLARSSLQWSLISIKFTVCSNYIASFPKTASSGEGNHHSLLEVYEIFKPSLADHETAANLFLSLLNWLEDGIIKPNHPRILTTRSSTWVWNGPLRGTIGLQYCIQDLDQEEGNAHGCMFD